MTKADFDRMKINLWVYGSIDQEDNGGWCSHLHCCIEGNHYTKTIGGYAKNTTPTRMTLQAIVTGLKQLKKKKPVFIHIYTSVVQVSTGLNKHMYNWAKKNWTTTRGQSPQHLDLWQQIYDILENPDYVISYKVHLQNQTENENRDRLFTIQTSAEYLLKGKKDLYEVAMA